MIPHNYRACCAGFWLEFRAALPQSSSKLYRSYMVVSPLPILLCLPLVVISALIGMPMVKKLVQIREARHELKRNSTSYIMGIAGWSVIAFWLMATWFFATILGDWAATDDAAGAVDRSFTRLWVLLQIAAEVAAND